MRPDARLYVLDTATIYLLAACLALAALAGLAEFVPGLGMGVLLSGPVIGLAMLAALGLTLVAILQARWGSVGWLALSGLVLVLATAQGSRVVFGVPTWMRLRIEAAVEAVTTEYGASGPFPRELSPPSASRMHPTCIYRPDGAESFEVTCEGVSFARCTYTHRSRSYSVWD